MVTEVKTKVASFDMKAKATDVTKITGRAHDKIARDGHYPTVMKTFKAHGKPHKTIDRRISTHKVAT